MIKPVVVLVLFLFISACQDSQRAAYINDSFKRNSEKAFLSIQKVFDFGEVDKNEILFKEISIGVENTGNAPLVLEKVDVSCGCMKPSYTKYPIKKGEKGCINVIVNTKNQSGIFNKSIIIQSNAKNHLEIIRIKGVVK